VPLFEFPHSTETPEMNDLVQLSDRAGNSEVIAAYLGK